MASKPVLQLRKCLVRAYNDEDTHSLAKAANNPRIAQWMCNTFPQPYTIKDAENWISITNTPSKLRDFAICETSGSLVIGGIGLKARGDIHYRTMEIGYWICEEYWHHGIATEVVSAFSDWAFENFAHLVRLEAEVFEGNFGSCRVLEKAGFEFEVKRRAAIEKFGDVKDTFIYVKFRAGY
ncbi:n-acetyltransferase p20 [Fusarium circinatum]|uniref:N-acetyltransferase p20 n=1 Tax=Fusarium circinatum TaxID=48490 RepID=A0A8H5XBM0_FUSCI|nr:n-acetyltransferase p20 [Fusarium circinatum]